MNVLLSSLGHWWNAEAAYAAALAEALIKDGHKAWLLAPPGTRNMAALKDKGLPVLEGLPGTRPGHWNPLALLSALRRFQAAEAVDVVNVFRSREFALHILAALGRGGPAVVRTRGSAQSISAHGLNRRLYTRWGEGLVLSSEAVANHLEGTFGGLHANHKVIYYPAPHLAARKYSAPCAPATAQLRKTLLREAGASEAALLLTMVGRVALEKGQEVLVQTMKSLLAETPEVRLLLVNKDYSGEMEQKKVVQKIIDTLELRRHVHWLGFRNDLPGIMAASDIGVIPSLDSEMNCRVAMEFFSQGTPVAVLPTGALPEVVEHARSGLVATDKTPAALAAELKKLIASADLRERLGQGALKAAQTRFSSQVFLEQTLSVYTAALALRRR